MPDKTLRSPLIDFIAGGYGEVYEGSREVYDGPEVYGAGNMRRLRAARN